VKEGAPRSCVHWAGAGRVGAHWADWKKGPEQKSVTFSSAATAIASKAGLLTPSQRPRQSSCGRLGPGDAAWNWGKISRRFSSKIAGCSMQPLGRVWTAAGCFQLPGQQRVQGTTKSRAKSPSLLTRARYGPARLAAGQLGLSQCPAGTEARGCAGTRCWQRPLAPCSTGRLAARLLRTTVLCSYPEQRTP
jgi:hypothetical protein